MDAASFFFHSVLPAILHIKHSHKTQQGSELARRNGPREKASHRIFQHVPRLFIKSWLNRQSMKQKECLQNTPTHNPLQEKMITGEWKKVGQQSQ